MTLSKINHAPNRPAFFFILFCSLFAFMACDTASKSVSPDQMASSSASETTSKVDSYTGQDLFKGVIFRAGTAAHLFNDVWKTDQVRQQATEPEDKALAEEYGDELKKAASEIHRTGAAAWFVERIETTNASFFPEFEKAMKSGDHLRIQEALVTAGELIRDISAKEVGQKALLARTPGELEAIEANAGSQLASGVYLYLETAVAAAAVAVVIVVAFAIDFTPIVADPDDPLAEREEPSLLFEEGVHYIATHLQTTQR